MNETGQKWDLWKLPTLFLWLAFFLAGLAPTYVFSALRHYAIVLPQNALINSPHMITIALAGYMAVFVFNRCLAAGASVSDAQDKAIQIGIFAWVAFLPLDFYDVILAYANPLVRNRTIVYFAAAMKLTAWWLLFVMVLRYYLMRGNSLFSGTVCLFPNAKPVETPAEDLSKEKMTATVQRTDGNALPDFIPDAPRTAGTPPTWPSAPHGRGGSSGQTGG